MSPRKRKTRPSVVKRHPSETVAAAGGFVTVYGYLSQVGWEPIPAAVAAVAAGAVPALVTWLRERTF